MLKRLLILSALTLFATLSAVAADRDEDLKRSHRAAEVFQAIMNAPDQGIPQDLLNSANWK